MDTPIYRTAAEAGRDLADARADLAGRQARVPQTVTRASLLDSIGAGVDVDAAASNVRYLEREVRRFGGDAA